nr:hypothetical protein [uncultured Sphingosinicella sp.]
MFALGIPFWLCIVGGAALSHTMKGWRWQVADILPDTAIVLGGAAIGTGIYSVLRRLTHLEFHRQVAATLLLVMAIAMPAEALLRGIRLANPLADPKPAMQQISASPGPNGATIRKVMIIPAEPKTAGELFEIKGMVPRRPVLDHHILALGSGLPRAAARP